MKVKRRSNGRKGGGNAGTDGARLSRLQERNKAKRERQQKVVSEERSRKMMAHRNVLGRKDIPTGTTGETEQTEAAAAAVVAKKTGALTRNNAVSLVEVEEPEVLVDNAAPVPPDTSKDSAPTVAQFVTDMNNPRPEQETIKKEAKETPSAKEDDNRRESAGGMASSKSGKPSSSRQVSDSNKRQLADVHGRVGTNDKVVMSDESGYDAVMSLIGELAGTVSRLKNEVNELKRERETRKKEDEERRRIVGKLRDTLYDLRKKVDSSVRAVEDNKKNQSKINLEVKESLERVMDTLQVLKQEKRKMEDKIKDLTEKEPRRPRNEKNAVGSNTERSNATHLNGGTSTQYRTDHRYRGPNYQVANLAMQFAEPTRQFVGPPPPQFGQPVHAFVGSSSDHQCAGSTSQYMGPSAPRVVVAPPPFLGIAQHCMEPNPPYFERTHHNN